MHPPAADEVHQLGYWLDDHGEIVFPLLGLAASALLDELVREGKLIEQKSAGGIGNYRFRGL